MTAIDCDETLKAQSETIKRGKKMPMQSTLGINRMGSTGDLRKPDFMLELQRYIRFYFSPRHNRLIEVIGRVSECVEECRSVSLCTYLCLRYCKTDMG